MIRIWLLELLVNRKEDLVFGLQATDLLGIAVVAQILFGPTRLPDLARGIGKGMKEFQNAMKDEAPKPSAEPKELSKIGQEEPA